MPRFLPGVLQNLTKIWGFQSNRAAPDFVDLESQVTPVLDLGRQGEIGSGKGSGQGYFVDVLTIVHPGAGTLRTSFNPWTRAKNQGVIPTDVTDYWGWILALTGNVDTPASLGVIVAGWEFIANSPPGGWVESTIEFPLYRGSASIGSASIFAANPTPLLQVTWDHARLPFPIFPTAATGGTGFGVVSTSTGVMTTEVGVLYWIGPRGARPAGVA